jgi:CubicO group peptidase (beta-lactamase class C family)
VGNVISEIKWTDSLSKHFPGIKVNKKLKDIAIQDLLAHRSGLEANPKLLRKMILNHLQKRQARYKLTEKFLKKDPKHPVGSFNYSNIGYIIVGNLLERITNKSWETLIQERIFIPLGMNSCGFGVTSNRREKPPTQPWGHKKKKRKIKSLQRDNFKFYGPAGTVYCNLHDWNKFLKTQVAGFNGLDTEVLKAESFKKLFSAYPDDKISYTFGGWFKLKRNWAGGTVFTHTGSNEFNMSNVWIAPTKEAVLMSTSNMGGDEAFNATNETIVKLITEDLGK